MNRNLFDYGFCSTTPYRSPPSLQLAVIIDFGDPEVDIPSTMLGWTTTNTL